MKKPDRFEKLVLKELVKRAQGPQDKRWPSLAAILLHRQYRAVVRLVKQQEVYGFEELISPRALLGALKKRGKGTP